MWRHELSFGSPDRFSPDHRRCVVRCIRRLPTRMLWYRARRCRRRRKQLNQLQAATPEVREERPGRWPGRFFVPFTGPRPRGGVESTIASAQFHPSTTRLAALCPMGSDIVGAGVFTPSRVARLSSGAPARGSTCEARSIGRGQPENANLKWASLFNSDQTRHIRPGVLPSLIWAFAHFSWAQVCMEQPACSGGPSSTAEPMRPPQAGRLNCNMAMK